MARIRLTLHNVSFFKDLKDQTTSQTDIAVSTDKETYRGLVLDGAGGQKVSYQLSLTSLKFQKKMYQPTEITAELHVGMDNDAAMGNNHIQRKTLEDLLMGKKVILESVGHDGSGEKVETIGDDFFVNDVHPHYTRESMTVTLKIFSLDKLMTMSQGCNVFVAKKLGAEILEEETKKYALPWDEEQYIDYNTEHMAVLKYDYATDKQSEHIFPYLVQYNETFYDLLKRTANRWGEFLYYEDGRLNVGYDQSQEPQEPGDWTAFDYCNLTQPVTSDDPSEAINLEAADDPNIVDTPLKKSPNELSDLPVCNLENGLDVWLMKKIESTLSRTESIPEYVGNQLFDEAYDYAMAVKDKNEANEEFDDTYFKEKEVEEQYGMAEFDGENREAFNQFTELNTPYTTEKYAAVLDKVQKAGQNAIVIDFDTTYPGLKLGQTIKFMNEEYIVVKVDCSTQKDANETGKSQLRFSVTATVKSDDGKFYPTLLPTGHIRTSAPQLATVFDTEDPLGQNRVRVLFPWQHLEPETDEEKEEASKVASPWLLYATSAASKANGIFGKHYVGDNVIVNFANGNVETPYIVGGLAMKDNEVPDGLPDKDIVLSSPAGHTLSFEDGSGAGLTAFLAGVLFPGYEMLTTFLPQTSGSAGDLMVRMKADEGISKQFEGGFELTDKYGIYSITGSTDGRKVSVQSPWGDVAIDAFTGISINAPNGDIEIKGKNITIEAGNNLELISGANVERSLFHEKKDTLLGTLGANATEIAAAVAKKLAEKVNFLDFSYIRALAELLKPPVEGALTVKSNRYLKLEAGKGECDYPKNAYKDRAAQDMIEDSEKEITEGLKVKKGMLELIEKTGALAAEVDRRYKKMYNKCVDLNIKDGGFAKTIAEAVKLANDYKTAGANTTICKNFEELKDRMWQKPYKELKESDLGFKDNYGTDRLENVTTEAATDYRTAHNIPQDVMTGTQIKELIIELRKQKKILILKAANKLHKAISEFQELDSLNGSDIRKIVGRFWITNVPDNYKASLKKAFDKDELNKGCNDCIYYKPVSGEAALLKQVYAENALEQDRKALARKAAVLLLEELGFKDEWRANDVDRPFKVEEVTDTTKWKEYVESIKNVPKLTPHVSVGMEILKDGLKGIVDVDNIKGTYDTMKGLFGGNAEISSWGDAQNGGILFSSGEDTFRLGDTIAPVEGFVKEKLGDSNEKVRDFLGKLQEKLKQLS